MEHRSPLENIFGIIPQGHDKPVKHAVYNAVALLLMLICMCSVWALYLILEPFIKPLMWALLVGSVLHPLKRSLRDKFQAWFAMMDCSRTPMIIGLMILPINIINDISEFIGSNLLKHIKLILAVGISIPAVHVFYYYTPRIITCGIWKLIVYTQYLISFIIDLTSYQLIILILIGYFSLMIFKWKPENNKRFHFISIAMWVTLSFYVAHEFSSFQVLVFLSLQIIFLLGFASEVYEIHKEMHTAGHHITLFKAIICAFHNQTPSVHGIENVENLLEEQEEKELQNIMRAEELTTDNVDSDTTSKESKVKFTLADKDKSPWGGLELFDESNHTLPSVGSNDSESIGRTTLLITNKGRVRLVNPSDDNMRQMLKNNSYKTDVRLKRSFATSQNEQIQTFYKQKRPIVKDNNTSSNQSFCPEQYSSDFYIYLLLWACVIMLFWKNVVLLPFLPIPILIYVIKHVGIYLGVWNLLGFYINKIAENIRQWCLERYDALIPVPIRGLYKITHKINSNMRTTVKESIDTVATCVVILGLIVFVTCFSIFIVVQIYAEGIMLVQTSSSVINQTVVHNPELRQLLPPTWDNTVDSILDNAYQYGREGISKVVKSIMSDADSVKSMKLEKQVLELWDRIYQTWMSSGADYGPKVTNDAIQNSWDAFVDDIQKSPEMFNLNGLIDFVKQNIGTLLSLLDSVWAILKGNMSIVATSFTAILSVILGGGTAVLNFILNIVVFLTTLFYLLSSSGEWYKPVECMMNFSSSGTRFALALEGAVNGVFTASFKMALFYGMWTWFIHNLFNIRIVYLPTMFATLLGAVPFLGTYWAGLPAVLDLWLAQNKGFQAILFAIFQFLPTYFVDTTIYKEIRGGGHPYLTGLAIAGGIFCLGVEGAIIGPLLLCGVFVAMDLSSSLFRDSPSDESLNLRLELQDA